MKTKRNFQVDIFIFVVFLLLFITGLALEDRSVSARDARFDTVQQNQIEHLHATVRDVHAAAGLVLLVGIGVHLVLHWRWIVTVTQRIFGKVARQARINYIIDALLLFFFFTICVTGVALWINGASESLISLHGWSAVMLLILSTVHVVLHWKWIKTTMRRYNAFSHHHISHRAENQRSDLKSGSIQHVQ